MHAIDRHVAEPRLGSADLDILAFAFVAFQRNAGHAPQSICDIRIGEAGDDFSRENLHDVVGSLFPIERFDLAPLAFAFNDDLLTDRFNLELGTHVRRTTSSEGHLLGKRRESDIGNLDGVAPGRQVGNLELALAVRYCSLPQRL
jgi:hypothetical protein